MCSQGCSVPHHTNPQPSARPGCLAWGSASTAELFWPQKIRYFWPHSSLRAGHQAASVVCWQKAATHGIATAALQSLLLLFSQKVPEMKGLQPHTSAQRLSNKLQAQASVSCTSALPRGDGQGSRSAERRQQSSCVQRQGCSPGAQQLRKNKSGFWCSRWNAEPGSSAGIVRDLLFCSLQNSSEHTPGSSFQIWVWVSTGRPAVVLDFNRLFLSFFNRLDGTVYLKQRYYSWWLTTSPGKPGILASWWCG